MSDTPLTFTVRRVLLHKLAEWAGTVVPSGHVALPVYACFRVEVAPGLLCLSASNGERAVWATTQAVSTGSTGVLFIPARPLRGILAEAPEGEIRFAVRKNFVVVTAGQAHWDLRMPDSGAYHELPDLGAAEFQRVGREALLTALRIVRHAVGKDSGRPQYTQVSVAEDGGVMYASAADSSQYSRAPLDGFPFPAAIPASVLDDLLKLLGGSPAEHAEVAQAGDDLVFRVGAVTLAVRGLAKEFPDARLLPLEEARRNEDELEADRSELLTAIRRVRVISETSSSAVALVLGDGTITLETRNRENVASEVIPAKWSAGHRIIVVSGQFLHDMLAAHPAQRCTFRVGAEAGAKKRRPPLLLEDAETRVAGTVPQMPPELAGY